MCDQRKKNLLPPTVGGCLGGYYLNYLAWREQGIPIEEQLKQIQNDHDCLKVITLPIFKIFLEERIYKKERKKLKRKGNNLTRHHG